MAVPAPRRTSRALLAPANSSRQLDKRPAAWLVYAIPHLIFHLSEYGALSPLDDLANAGVLTLAVVLPVLLLAVSSRAGEADGAPSR